MKRVQHKTFSEREVNDLLKAWIAISLAFAIAIGGFSISITFAIGFLISALTVGIGFIFHELSHRFVARSYGCFAEFRSFDSMLVLAVVMSFFGFVFAAPGAVMISGPVGKSRNGKISAAGPLANLILGFLFLVVLVFISPEGTLRNIAYYGFMVNSWLALFNMIPAWNFDGKKILNWNKLVYGSMVGVSLMFMFIMGSL